MRWAKRQRIAFIGECLHANGGRGGAGKGRRGKPGIELTPEQKTLARGAWKSREFTNDAERLDGIEALIGKRLKRGWCWTHFGSPSGQAQK